MFNYFLYEGNCVISQGCNCSLMMAATFCIPVLEKKDCSIKE